MAKQSVKFFLLFFLLLSVIEKSFSQVQVQDEQIRIQVWAELDAFPGAEEKSDAETEFDKIFGFAIERTKEITPFLLGGMLSGWNFEYTPYDKIRKVQEYFEFSEVLPFNPEINTVTFNEPRPLEDRLVCWVYCNRTEFQRKEFQRWNSIVYPKIKGTGSAGVEKGFEGIREACGEALKNAVREYWRQLIKNKPKEISGRVLLIKEPRIYIKSGRYTVELDFFMETDRIIEYSNW